MRPRPGTTLRPTVRGIVLAVTAGVLWVLSDLTRVTPGRTLAAALLLIVLVGALCIALSVLRLRARRWVVDDAVPAGARARVQIDLAPDAVFTRLPLGRGVVREHLPAALGGPGDLPLAEHIPHVLGVARRGDHALGPLSLEVRDVFGIFHWRRTVADGARIVGLPVAEPVDGAAARALGIARDGETGQASAGAGDVGPIARRYASGDDIRRIHWRASARAGTLMTREDEPALGRSAVIVLDTRRQAAHARTAEDRLVDLAASFLAALRSHGWQVRVLDAGGEEITRAERRRGQTGGSPLGREVDAVAERTALLALAELEFDEDPERSTLRTDHATGASALVIALGVDDGAPFHGLDLDRFAGRATHRTAIALREAPGPGGADSRSDATSSHADGWTRIRGTTAHSLHDLLTATEEHPEPRERTAPAAGRDGTPPVGRPGTPPAGRPGTSPVGGADRATGARA